MTSQRAVRSLNNLPKKVSLIRFGVEAHLSLRHKEKVPKWREVENGRCTISPFPQLKKMVNEWCVQTGLPQLN